MTMCISFAWTTAPLLAEEKDRTRRTWKSSHVRKFKKGDLVHAYDKDQRYGGIHVATIRLTATPRLEPIDMMPDEDYVREGFSFLHDNQHYIPESDALGIRELGGPEAFRQWRDAGGGCWIIDFEIVKILVSLEDWWQRKFAATVKGSGKTA